MTNTLQQDALKACPFCGGEVERVLPPSSDMPEYIRHKPPSSCAVEFSAFLLDDDLSVAWNTRPTDALKAENQRLREALKTARDYVRDADAGELIYRNGLRVDRDMTRDDLARIDAALTDQPHD